MDADATLLTLKQLCERFPDHDLTPRKLTGWIKTGCRGVRLKATRVGHPYKVCPIDYLAFVDRLTSDSLPEERPTERERRASSAATMAALRAMGVRVGVGHVKNK